ncbi:MAG: hypothetical protein H5T85_01160 [Actinobacteria bacterium]|nr:hypothetical protein [Actinomycetota bacterium]
MGVKDVKFNRLLEIRKKASLFFMSFILLSFFQIVFPAKLHAITLKELGQRISELSQQEQKLIEEIIASEALVENKRNQIESLNSELAQFEDELSGLYQRSNELKKSIEEKRKLLEEKVVFSYKYQNNNIAKIVISARDINEVVNTLYLFRNVMKREAELIESLRLEEEEYGRILRKSEEKKREIEQVKNKIQQEEQKLVESIKKNKSLLDRVKNERQEVQSLLNEVKKRIAQIQPPGLTLVGEWEMIATAYYSAGGGLNGDGIAATGLRVKKGIVAVDPRVIPLGTKLYIPGYGEALAADTGGWIKGNRIDLAFDTLEECFRFGRRRIRVYLVED